jgi:hypothetical protein
VLSRNTASFPATPDNPVTMVSGNPICGSSRSKDFRDQDRNKLLNYFEAALANSGNQSFPERLVSFKDIWDRIERTTSTSSKSFR